MFFYGSWLRNTVGKSNKHCSWSKAILSDSNWNQPIGLYGFILFLVLNYKNCWFNSILIHQGFDISDKFATRLHWLSYRQVGPFKPDTDSIQLCGKHSDHFKRIYWHIHSYQNSRLCSRFVFSQGGRLRSTTGKSIERCPWSDSIFNNCNINKPKWIHSLILLSMPHQ